jgi:hypothetical protein
MAKAHESKWVQEIVNLQREDGSWGFFHTLSQPTKKQPMTTEQALRRLRILGLTKDDECVRRALEYVDKCISGESSIPDRAEVKPDWGLFVETMLATWLKIYIPDHKQALAAASRWAQVVEDTFAPGFYDQNTYERAYRNALHPKGKDVWYFKSFVNFYPMMLLSNMLTPKTESRMLDFVISYPTGIYYITGKPLNELPKDFTAREATYYLAAIEILADYRLAGSKLGFVVEWLKKHQDKNGKWDMGVKVKDSIYFPLSDSWRKPEDRKRDSTDRITKLIRKLEGQQERLKK